MTGGRRGELRSVSTSLPEGNSRPGTRLHHPRSLRRKPASRPQQGCCQPRLGLLPLTSNPLAFISFRDRKSDPTDWRPSCARSGGRCATLTSSTYVRTETGRHTTCLRTSFWRPSSSQRHSCYQGNRTSSLGNSFCPPVSEVPSGSAFTEGWLRNRNAGASAWYRLRVHLAQIPHPLLLEGVTTTAFDHVVTVLRRPSHGHNPLQGGPFCPRASV